jgi:hypothetical protein
MKRDFLPMPDDPSHRIFNGIDKRFVHFFLEVSRRINKNGFRVLVSPKEVFYDGGMKKWGDIDVDDKIIRACIGGEREISALTILHEFCHTEQIADKSSVWYDTSATRGMFNFLSRMDDSRIFHDRGVVLWECMKMLSIEFDCESRVMSYITDDMESLGITKLNHCLYSNTTLFGYVLFAEGALESGEILTDEDLINAFPKGELLSCHMEYFNPNNKKLRNRLYQIIQESKI